MTESFSASSSSLVDFQTDAPARRGESQRSGPQAQQAVNTAPSLTGLATSVVFDEIDVNAAPALFAADVVLTDPDDNFYAGTVTVSGVRPEDRIGLLDGGSDGDISVLSGFLVLFRDVQIGSISGGEGETLTITFNEYATTEAVQATIRSLTYATDSDTPDAGRFLNIQVTDAAGATLADGPAAFEAQGTDMPYAVDGSQDILNPAFADLNDDGLLDLVTGTFDGVLKTYFRNSDGTLTQQEGEDNPFDGINVNSMASPAFVDLNLDGRLDLVVAGASNTGFRAFFNNGDGSFTEQVGDDNPFNGIGLSTGQEADLAFTDVDGDGDMDLVTTTLTGIRYYQNVEGSFIRRTAGDDPFLPLGISSPKGLTFLDVNADGLLDLIVRSGDELEVARAKGDGSYTLLTSGENPLTGLGTLVHRPQAVDYDGDGDLDLIYGIQWGYLYAFRNDATSGADIQVNVAPSNDAPATTDVTKTIDEDTPYTFSADDFAFSDPDGNAMAGVVITSVYGAGSLALGGVPVSEGQLVAVADIGNLVFTPGANANGAAAAGFGFRVADNGSDFLDRHLSDVHGFSFDVTPVNDAPTFGEPAVSLERLTANTDVYPGYTVQNMSADGNLVLLTSSRPLALDDTDQVSDLYLFDRGTGEFTRLLSPEGVSLSGYRPVISADGTKIAFTSTNATLVADDTNGVVDFFVFDRVQNTIVRVNTGDFGQQAQGSSMYDDILFSPDGTMVLFSTYQGLQPDDSNNNVDVYLKNLVTGELERLSSTPAGGGVNAGSLFPFFSADGTKVGFSSDGALLPGDVNGRSDIYIRDLTTGEIVRASVGVGGAELALTNFSDIFFSPDGSTLLFNSFANGARQIYTLDLASGELVLISASAAGETANDYVGGGRFLPDGIHVLFSTSATNLIPGEVAPPNSFGTFLKNIVTGEIVRLTVDADGNPLANNWNLVGFANGGNQLVVGSQYGILPGDPQFNTGELYLVTLNTLASRYVDGKAPVLIAPGVTIADIDSANFDAGVLSVEITGNYESGDTLSIATSALPGNGIEIDGNVISFNGNVIGNLYLGDNVFEVALNAAATPEAVTALARAIQFSSPSSQPSEATRTITFTLRDGNSEDYGTFTRNVQVVDANNAPNSGDATITVTEDQPYQFSAADFPFGDGDGDALGGVVIVSLPDGDLKLDGEAVEAGQFIAAADLALLTYTPPIDGSGTNYSSLTFQVRDTGGTADGGVNQSDTHTITFDVTNVNDAPVLGVESGLVAIGQGTGLQGGEFNYGGVSADGNLIAFVSDRQLVANDTDDVRDLYLLDRMTGDYTRLVSGAGGDEEGDLYETRISADGTKIAFLSTHSHLVAGDTNGFVDLFVVDVATGGIVRVNEGADGSEGIGFYNGWFDFAFSPDGNSVAFSVYYNGMVPGDDNFEPDVFIKNLTTGELERVSVSPEGTQFAAASYGVFFSPDGTTLGFLSRGAVTADDDNGVQDIFLRDMETGEVTRVTLPGGVSAGDYYDMSFSPDGTKILFSTGNATLLAGDENNQSDIFLFDLESGELTLVSSTALGAFGNGYAYGAKFMPDGEHVIFTSNAYDLIPDEGLTDYLDGLFMKNIVTGEITRLSVNADGTPTTLPWYLTGVTDTGILITSDTPLLPGVDDDGSYALYELTLGTATAHYIDSKGPVTVAPDMTVSDADLTNFDGGTLSVEITAMGDPDALLVLESTTPGTGFELVDNYLFFNGSIIGTWEATPSGLAFAFNSAADSAAVQALVRAIQFTIFDGLPSEATRDITFTLTDGDGGTASVVRQVTVTEISDAPQSSGGYAELEEGGTYIVSAGDIDYFDPDGDALVDIVVDTLPGGGTLFLNGVAVTEGQAISVDDILADKLVYVSSGWGSFDATFRLRDNGDTANGGSNVSDPVSFIFNVARINDNPVLKLHYEDGANTSVTLQEQGTTRFASTSDIEDDTPFYTGGTLTVSVAGMTGDDFLRITTANRVSVVGDNVYVNGLLVGTKTGGEGAALVVTFNADATQGNVERVLQAIEYGNRSDTPPESRTITVVVTDGEGGTATGTATINIQPVDDLASAQDDEADVVENATVIINIFANETDVDGGAAPVLAAVDGFHYVSAGFTYTLDSGAEVTYNEDGTLTYNPNGAFDWLISEETAALTGANNTVATDRFSYNLSNGSVGWVEVTITGAQSQGDRLYTPNPSSNNNLTGTGGSDIFMLAGGGDDTADGGDGIDGFYMGNALSPGDVIDGGASNDLLGLQGNYSGYTFSETNLAGIETLILMSGEIMDYGGGLVRGEGSPDFGYSYDLTTIDANVAAGQTFLVHATTLQYGESLRFDGSAETDGSFFFYGGNGDDTLIGGAGNDVFASALGQDTLTGGGGNDVFYYRFTDESSAFETDHITDFTAGDRLHLWAFGEASGNGISFIGEGDFTGVGGQLRVTGSGNDWIVEIDVDGDGEADFVLDVTTTVSQYAWSAADFVM